MNTEQIFALLIAGINPEDVSFDLVAFDKPAQLVNPNTDTPALQTTVTGVTAAKVQAYAWEAEGYAVAYRPQVTDDQRAQLESAGIQVVG